MAVLLHLRDKFEEDKVYSEKQINSLINKWHIFGDYFILRRLLIDYKFLCRTTDGGKYWVNRKDGET
ncbi:MAG: DUF2087 domain-containing protein [Eubacteriales bacterium]